MAKERVHIAKRVSRALGFEIGRYRPSVSEGRIVSLAPSGEPRGRVLLSYVLDPFLTEGKEISHNHTHDWESYEIAESFLRRGYAVDVVNYDDQTFEPTTEYAVFFSARTNFDRISKRLDADCKRVAHLDTAHWLFNNAAAYQRLLDVQRRRNVTLDSVRLIEPNWAIENADMATVLGNQFTVDTYRYAEKPIHRIPISVPSTYPWNAGRDFDIARKNFMWFGSGGFVHKGLDLVLEAFAAMPSYHLYVCGPLNEERAFIEAYRRELFETTNIHAIGWVDVMSDRFRELAGNCVGLVYPSCAEGGGASAITCMHAGLIPILSYEASVDVEDSGVILSACSIDEIRGQVSSLSQRSIAGLEGASRATWELARRNHTRERFSSHIQRFIDGSLL
jgi:glycosyltransferase involved in cell wall biosynthesis